jgi:hypothetical protein
VLKPFLYFFPALALFAAGCATRDNSDGSPSPVVETVSGKEEDRRAAELVRVTEFHWDRSGKVPALVGTVANGSDTALNVNLTFVLLDPSAKQVDSVGAHIPNLQPGSQGGFRVVPAGIYLLRLHGVDYKSLRARLFKIDVSR